MKIKKIKQGYAGMAAAMIVMLIPAVCFGAENRGSGTRDVYITEDMTVTAKKTIAGIEMAPQKNTINIESYQSVTPATSVVDLLKTQPTIDFRSESNLDPGVDSIFLRGFDSKRFITAIDGVAVMKTGGRSTSNIVDYGTLPLFMFESIEVLPGPHSALFDSRAIGGAVNLKTRKPRQRATLKPDLSFSTSYGSYDTSNTVFSISGAAQKLTYDASYRFYSTDGYLRHSQTDIKSGYGRVGYLLPADGFISLSFGKTDTDRNVPVNNPGTAGDYDGGYPKVSDSGFEPYQDPTWDGDSYTYRLALEQPTPWGDVFFSAYTGKDNRIKEYYTTPASTEPYVNFDTQWWQKGGKLQDEYTWKNGQVTTLGFDMTWLYDDGLDDTKTERMNKQAGYIQHQLTLGSAVDLTLGLRHEDVETVTTNDPATPFYLPWMDTYIHRDFDAWLPKFFATWRMDHMARAFRDTSVSLGVSRIWRAPDYHGDYNMLNRPTGAFLEPEDGIGYDLVFERRLIKDIQLKADFSFYDINDFIASNSDFSQTMGPNAGTARFSDIMINLEEVYRYGIDLELGGHIVDRLSFYIAYSWQDFDNRGDEPAGQQELDERARHHVKAGLRYALFKHTTLMLDYRYQSDQVTEVYEEIADNVWNIRETEIDAYHTVDVAVEQVLLEQKGMLRDMKLKLYIQNLFDENYYDTAGYPGTDLTFGAGLAFRF